MKRFIYFSVFILFAYLTLSHVNTDGVPSLFWYDKEDKYFSAAARAVNRIQADTAMAIKAKYNISVIGSACGMPGNIVEFMGLDFQSNDKLSKKELTKLLFALSKEMLENINSDKEIQSYLIHRPFTVKDVSIIIYNTDKGRDPYDPDIAVARLSDGMVIFKTNDPDKEFTYKTKTFEKYEDVLKRMQEEENCQ